MRLGCFTMPIHPLHRPLTETLKEDRELARVADRLGFVEVFPRSQGVYGRVDHLCQRNPGSLVQAGRAASGHEPPTGRLIVRHRPGQSGRRQTCVHGADSRLSTLAQASHAIYRYD